MSSCSPGAQVLSPTGSRRFKVATIRLVCVEYRSPFLFIFFLSWSETTPCGKDTHQLRVTSWYFLPYAILKEQPAGSICYQLWKEPFLKIFRIIQDFQLLTWHEGTNWLFENADVHWGELSFTLSQPRVQKSCECEQLCFRMVVIFWKCYTAFHTLWFCSFIVFAQAATTPVWHHRFCLCCDEKHGRVQWARRQGFDFGLAWHYRSSR